MRLHPKNKLDGGQITTFLVGCRGYVVGGCRGYVVGEIKIKANSAQLELELRLSLAKED